MEREKTLTLIDMIGMTLSAFVSMELIASMAKIGPSVIVSFIILGGSYLYTHCVLCAELGSTYPEQGGIYSWVKKALGPKWAGRTNWWYWVNCVGFVPSVMIPFVAIFKQLFWPDMTLTMTIMLSVAGTWLIVLFNIIPLKDSKHLNNIGTAAKILFCLSLIVGGIYYAVKGNAVVSFNAGTMVPKFDLTLVALIPVFVYGLTGMDAVGCASEEMKNPKKDMPKALIISSLVSVGLYIFSTMAVEFILPADAIDGTTGLIDAIMVIYGGSKVFVILIAICLALLFFSNAFAWPLAANKVILEAAEAGEFPKVFVVKNKYGSPVGASVILGIAATGLIVFYGMIATSNEGLFWSILAFTGVVYLAPYVLLSLAFIKLRKADPDKERPFKAPGSKFAIACAVYHMLILIGSCISFLFPQGGGIIGTVVILVSLIITQIVGEIMIARSINTK